MGSLIALLLLLAATPATAADNSIGVAVMHGKGGRPGKFVIDLAQTLEAEGFQVANLEMPWSGRRQYDTDIQGAAAEVTQALEGLRSRGANRLFVAGHSQGGLFALIYAGRHQVDGVIPIAPGGAVDAAVYRQHVGEQLAAARQMVAEGRGGEQAAFKDYEGSRGTNPVTTTAALYFNWFDPDGEQTSRAFARLKAGTPVLYVAPAHDYPALAKLKRALFGMLPPHGLSRLYEPESDHLNAPAAAAAEVAKWIREVASQ
jgi:pimeloyl-ACP methyl ester carboxylesterase